MDIVAALVIGWAIGLICAACIYGAIDGDAVKAGVWKYYKTGEIYKLVKIDPEK